MLRSLFVVLGSASGVALLGITLFGEPSAAVHGLQRAISGEGDTAGQTPQPDGEDPAMAGRLADLRLEVATLTKSVATLQDQAARETNNLDYLKQKRQEAQINLERVKAEQDKAEQARAQQAAADKAAAETAAAEQAEAEQQAAQQAAARKAADAAAQQAAAEQAAAQKAATEQAAAQKAAAEQAATQRAAAEQAAAQKAAAEQAAVQRAEVAARQAAARQAAAQAQQAAAEKEAAEQAAVQRAAAEKAAVQQAAARKAAVQRAEAEQAAIRAKAAGAHIASSGGSSASTVPDSPDGAAAIVAHALPPPPATAAPQGRDMGQAEIVLNRLRHRVAVPNHPETTPVLTEAAPEARPADAQRYQRARIRLGQANAALWAGRLEDAQRLLQQVQLQLVFQPADPDQYDAGRTSRAAGEVAQALGALGNGDPSGALRAISQATESLGAAAPRVADAEGGPQPFASSSRRQP